MLTFIKAVKNSLNYIGGAQFTKKLYIANLLKALSFKSKPLYVNL